LNEEQRKRARAKKMKSGVGHACSWFRRRGWIFCLLLAAVGMTLWHFRFYVQRFNPLEFRYLQIVEIDGNRMLTWEDIMQGAQVETGMPMSELNADSVKASLLQIPLIHSVEVEKRFPSFLKIHVQEATPVASVIEEGKATVYTERGLVLPMALTLALHLPIVAPESMDKIATVTEFLSTMRKNAPLLYGKVSQVAWDDADSAMEVFFSDAAYRTLFPSSGWNESQFRLYDSLRKGFSGDLRCAGEVDLRFDGFAYIRDFDKRCLNG
jgi:cell division protein FtsQ